MKIFLKHFLQKTYALVMFMTTILFCFTSLANAAAPYKNKYIAYTDVGKGTPLVLIHAFPTDQQLWAPQQEALKEYFRVITLDLWGFGHSASADGQAITMTAYADEIKQLLDDLHLSQAIIAGESMGGYIALAFLKKYPQQVSGLILSDTQSIADTEEAKVKREATAQDVLKHGTSELINGFMTKALSVNASAETKQILRHILTTQKNTGIASALRGMALREETSAVLSQTNIPILILTGDKDALISPEQSQHMHALAKQSKLIIIANAGHLSNLEQAKAWNQAVVNSFATTQVTK